MKHTLYPGAQEDIKDTSQRPAPAVRPGDLWEVHTMSWTLLLLLPLLTQCPGSRRFQRPNFGRVPLPLFYILNMHLFSFQGPVLRLW